MKKFFLLLLLSFPLVLSAQDNGIWLVPAQPVKGDAVEIHFDPYQNSAIPNTSTAMVLHWGINGWQTPPPGMRPAGSVIHTDGIAARTAFTKLTDNDWVVTIQTDNTVDEFNFVVNTGTPSTPGANWAHNSAGNDWVYQVFDPELTLVLLKPVINMAFGDPLRSPVFVKDGQQLAIEAVTVNAEGGVKSYHLEIGGSEIPVAGTDTLKYSVEASSLAGGPNDILAIVEDNSSRLDTVVFTIFKTPANNVAEMPANYKYGINYIDDNTIGLVLYAPGKDFAYAIGDFSSWQVALDYQMNKTPNDSIFWLTINGLDPNQNFAFQYLVDGKKRIADPYTELILDPWNDPFISGTGLPPYPGGMTSGVTSIIWNTKEDFEWSATGYSRPNKSNLIIYEMWLSNFLEDHSYETLTDTLDYLQRLGINAIELQPVNEFEGNVSWGYNPSFYFALDKYYGTPAQFKRFVDECHKRNIAVIIDMVLNHSYDLAPYVQLYTDDSNAMIPGNPFYNVSSPNPVFSWGRDFNHESSATKAFVDRVNEYWLTEYNVDGFRFDFTKGFTNTPGDGGAYDLARINILKRMYDKIVDVDPTAYVILEHLADNSEETVLANYGMMLWGNLNYNYNEATMGWHDGEKSNFSGISYVQRGWNNPALVGYMESHDEERLMYKNLQYGNSTNPAHNVKNLAVALKRIELAATFFIPIPGPKMIWQFGELGFDYSINYPSGTGDSRLALKPFIWDTYYNEPARQSLYNVFASLNYLKTNYPAFSATTFNLALSAPAKRIKLTHGSMNVIILGNFNVNTDSIAGSFHYAGKWYEFFTGDSITVSNTEAKIVLQPGEYRLYTSSKIENPYVGTEDTEYNYVSSYDLLQNYPNPFNPTTTIRYQIPENGLVSLKVYNLLGQEVKTLVSEEKTRGSYEVKWNGDNNFGSRVASGIYFYRIESGKFIKTNKMIMLK